MVVTKVAKSAVIIPHSKIDITNSYELGKKLAELCEAGVKDITIDFSNVCRIDCSGLGKLLLAQKKMREAQGGLRIININNEFVSKLFSLVQLERVIPLETIN